MDELAELARPPPALGNLSSQRAQSDWISVQEMFPIYWPWKGLLPLTGTAENLKEVIPRAQLVNTRAQNNMVGASSLENITP